MWVGQQQLLKAAVDRLVKGNKLSKTAVLASEVGMTDDEFDQKVSFNPRTPLQNEERIRIEHEIMKRDLELYNEYLCHLHLCDRIVVERG
jgi:hypothetical protein